MAAAACLGRSISAMRLTIIVCAVTSVGVKGNGNAIYAETHSSATKTAIFVMVFTVIWILPFLVFSSIIREDFLVVNYFLFLSLQ